MGTWQPPTQHLGAVKPTARKLHGQQGESRTPQSPPPNTTAPPPLENVACTSSAYSKQSCVFSSVCLQQVPGNKTGLIKAVLWSSNQPEHVALLQHYLNNYFQRQYTVTCQGATPTGDTNASLFEVERSPTVLWAANPANQQSLGHAMVNEVRGQNVFWPRLQHLYGTYSMCGMLESVQPQSNRQQSWRDPRQGVPQQAVTQ